MSDETTRLRALLEQTEMPWRVVLASGEVLSVEAWTDADGVPWARHRTASGEDLVCSHTPREAVVRAVAYAYSGIVEILAPGEPTRAELAAQLAAVTRERDVLRAQQGPLLDAHDALVAAARAAGWTGAGATGAELVAWVRRGALLDAARIAMERGGERVAKAIVARANEEGGE